MYDGTSFDGMQLQRQGRTIAGTLQGALLKRLQQPSIRVVAAGRTDAGVHARGQTVHFDAAPIAEPEQLSRALNSMLPPDLRVLSVEPAVERDEFGRPWHSTHWAAGKLYSYRLHNGPLMDPTDRLYRHHVPWSLDINAMREAAEFLQGEIDCAALANRRAGEPLPVELEPAATTRHVRAVEIVEEGGGNVRCDFHVKGALYKMVRNAVGLILAVGSHRHSPNDVPGLLGARARAALPAPAPAHGLTLESVFYDVGWGGAYQHPLHPQPDLVLAAADSDCSDYADSVTRGAAALNRTQTETRTKYDF